MKNGYTFFTKLGIVILLFAIIFYISGITAENLKSLLFVNFSLSSLLLVTSLFILNFYLVAARLYLSYKQFNVNISYNSAKEALIASQIGGIIPIFGAALGQAANLSSNHANVSSISSSFIFFYERIIMAASGLFLSIIAGYYAFGDRFLFKNLEANVTSIEFVVALLITLMVVFWKGMHRNDRAILLKYFSRRNTLYVSAGFLLSLSSWLLSSTCFLICLYPALKTQAIQPSNYMALFYASSMVSFIASMPFSVNGWGVREFAAISLFGMLAIPKDIALFSSISVGLYSILALLVFGTILYLKKEGFNLYKIAPKNPINKPSSSSKNKLATITDKRVIYLIGCLTAFFIFFQAYFVINQLRININIADVLAVCCFIIIALQTAQKHELNFRIPHVNLFIKAAASAFLMSFIIGYFKFGFSNFAFFSKFIGFFVLIGYAAAGAMFIGITREKGINILLQLMISVLISIVALQIIMNLLVSLRLLTREFYHGSLVGYASNRNSFAIQILCILAMQLAILKPLSKQFLDKNYWFVAILLAALYFTFSRAGIITCVALFLALICVGSMKLRQLGTILTQTFIIILGILFITEIITYIYNFNGFSNAARNAQVESIFTDGYSQTISNSQRIYSIVESFKLWLQNPLFGIGLGGFVNHAAIESGYELVIHNTFLWVLVEFGIVGSSVFFWYGFVLLKHLYNLLLKLKATLWNTQDKILFNTLIIFLLMGSAHEVFYQRIFWFILGITIVAYSRVKQTLAVSQDLTAPTPHLL